VCARGPRCAERAAREPIAPRLRLVYSIRRDLSRHGSRRAHTRAQRAGARRDERPSDSTRLDSTPGLPLRADTPRPRRVRGRGPSGAERSAASTETREGRRARRDARRVSPPRARESVAGRKDFSFPSVSSHWSHHQSCQNCQAWCQVRQVLDFRSSDHPIIVIEARGGATTRSVRNYEQSARGPHRHAVRCWSPPFET
jgi:hypothetical protein